LLVVPLLFFAGIVAVRASVDLTLANLSSTFALLLLFVYFFAEGRVESLGLLGYPLAAGRMLVAALQKPRPIASHLAKQATSNPNHTRRMAEIMRGVLIALPIL